MCYICYSKVLYVSDTRQPGSVAKVFTNGHGLDGPWGMVSGKTCFIPKSIRQKPINLSLSDVLLIFCASQHIFYITLYACILCWSKESKWKRGQFPLILHFVSNKEFLDIHRLIHVVHIIEGICIFLRLWLVWYISLLGQVFQGVFCIVISIYCSNHKNKCWKAALTCDKPKADLVNSDVDVSKPHRLVGVGHLIHLDCIPISIINFLLWILEFSIMNSWRLSLHISTYWFTVEFCIIQLNLP